ncbi:FecR family protein [Pseudomonas asplenii]|uniref:FecR family protein n=1 Tax=Pseudomonas asplenii TaxID=53407 RepID=UPI0022342B3E|nr:FecR domain-containing protein [Pseudomonas asplenii]UZE27107.1 DUF4880 domain-containing protein [Pseudomonas asplenii]
MSKASKKSTDDAAEQAIEWMVLLRSGEATLDDEHEFAAWRARSAEHDQACAYIEATLGRIPLRLAPTQHQAVRSTLLAPSRRREFLRNALCVAAVGVVGGALVDRTYPVGNLLADLSTRTSERRTLTLGDGSSLTLNARSAVNIDIDEVHGKRKIKLMEGEMLLQAAASRLPLSVQLAGGRVELGSGRLSIRHLNDGFRVAALTGPVQVWDATGNSRLLAVGQGASVGANGFNVFPISAVAECSWTRGLLVVDDQPLATVIEALRNYRTGVVRLDPQAAVMRVSGIFPLDDSDNAIESIAQTLPIIVQRTTGFWVSISAA